MMMNWTTLIDIFNSTDGFRNADGDAITILYANDFTNFSHEQFKAMYYDPWDKSARTRYWQGRGKQLFVLSDVDKDNATGKLTATIHGDLTVGDRTPDGYVDHGLEAWEIDYIGNNIFSARLYVTSVVDDDEATTLTPDGLMTFWT